MALCSLLPRLRSRRRPAPTAPPVPVVKSQKPAKGSKHAAKLPKYLADANLTPEQTEKVHAIQKDSAEKTQTVRADTTLTVDQKAAKLKEIKKDTRTQIMALLTPEQKEKIKAAKKDAPASPAAPAPTAPKN